MLECRIIFGSEIDRNEAEHVLDENGCDYDYDSGGRMMINNDGLEVLSNTSTIDFDVVV